MVITGDPQQRDRKVTGLETAESKLASCPNVAFVRFGIEEVVRHETVQDILNLWG
jgi:phosphate starvation-inducible protein PhoH